MSTNAAELFDRIMGSTFPALMSKRDPDENDVGLLLAGQNPPKGVRLMPADIGKPQPIPSQETTE